LISTLVNIDLSKEIINMDVNHYNTTGDTNMQTLLNRYANGEIEVVELKAYIILANAQAEDVTYILSFNSAMQPVIEERY